MTAAFILGINMFIAALFGVAFAVVARSNPVARGAGWLAGAYALGVADVTLEFLLPWSAHPTTIGFVIFYIYLAALTCGMIGVSKHYRAPLPTAEEPQHGARRGGGRGDADIHAVVHGVHDGPIVAGGVAVSEEGSPEIGLHVHDVDARARGQRVIHPAVGATAGPGQRVLAIERYRDRRHVDVGVVGGDRRRPASVEGGGDDRDGVPGSLEELALQAHRDLRATERFDVLIAEHHHVHGVTPGAVRRGRGLRRCRGCG